MQISIKELAQMLGGTVEGDETALLNSVAKIEEGKLGSLSFLANPKYEEHLYTTQSSAVLVSNSFQPTHPYTTNLIRVEDPYAAFTLILQKYSNPAIQLTGIEPNCFVATEAVLGQEVYVGAFAYISKNAKIGDNTKIYPNVFLGQNVTVGNNCIIYPNVVIYHDCVLGDNCIIHSGTVIGSDGFGFAPLPDRSYKKIPQTGNVVIENDVEIGSNCSIDRATMGSTIIRKGTKLDNLIQVAHNVEIGEHSVMAGQAGIAGSTQLGKYIVVGGQVAIAGHLKIADGNQFGGQSGIMASISEPEKKWFGTPVMEVRDSLRVSAVQRRLPELLKRIEALEKELKKQKGE